MAHAVYPSSLGDLASAYILLLTEPMVRIALKHASIGRTICYLGAESVLHIVYELTRVGFEGAIEAGHVATPLHHSVNKLAIVEEVTLVIAQRAMAVGHSILPISRIILVLHPLHAISMFLAVHELSFKGVPFASVLLPASAAQHTVFPEAAVCCSIFDA